LCFYFCLYSSGYEFVSTTMYDGLVSTTIKCFLSLAILFYMCFAFTIDRNISERQLIDQMLSEQSLLQIWKLLGERKGGKGGRALVCT
jgi:hypothetical protein